MFLCCTLGMQLVEYRASVAFVLLIPAKSMTSRRDLWVRTSLQEAEEVLREASRVPNLGFPISRVVVFLPGVADLLDL